ncbi:MAG: sugar ABC transporter permease [Bacillota bacterium]|nr:sugar ABC transporter permease [Bacillota bacterium]
MIAVGIVWPAVQTIGLAFVDAHGRFVGLQNFVSVLQNPETVDLGRFPFHSPPWGSLLHNAVWIVLHLPLSVILGLLLAVLLQRAHGAAFLKGVVFLGMVIPMIVGGVLVRFLFDEHAGVVNGVLRAVGLAAWARTWTDYPQTALFALILGSVWLWTGFAMLLYSAGLTAIPRDYYEAAAVDGASPWQQFLHVTVPGLRPMTTVIVAMTVLWELKLFDLVYTATLGGPGGSTLVLALQMYFYGFRALDPNRAAAVATLLSLLTLAVGVGFVRSSREGA